MDFTGISLCCRYANPPNALSLCGPSRQPDLQWYTSTGQADQGTAEILEQFKTLYPYLRLIAHENDIKDPFDPHVVEAYWIGNPLLEKIPVSRLAHHITEGLGFSKRVKKKTMASITSKLPDGFAHHAFHVLNTYRRSGHLDIPYTVETLDACLVHWGTVVSALPTQLLLKTQSLQLQGNTLTLKPTERLISIEITFNQRHKGVLPGDLVSYHWGRYCQTLTKRHVSYLRFYTNQALKLANRDLDL